MWVPLVGPTPFFSFSFSSFSSSFSSLLLISSFSLFLFFAFFACSCREEAEREGAGRRTAQRGARGQDGGVRPRRRGRRAWRGTQEAAGQPVGWHGRQPGATRARQCTAGRRHCSSRGHDPRRRATGAAAASAGAAPAEAASGQEEGAGGSGWRRHPGAVPAEAARRTAGAALAWAGRRWPGRRTPRHGGGRGGLGRLGCQPGTTRHY